MSLTAIDRNNKMKITKSQLKQVIKEEIMKTLKEVNGELTEDQNPKIQDN